MASTSSLEHRGTAWFRSLHVNILIRVILIHKLTFIPRSTGSFIQRTIHLISSIVSGMDYTNLVLTYLMKN